MKPTIVLFYLLLLLSCNKTPTGPGDETGLPQWPMFAGNMSNTSNASDDMDYFLGPSQGQIVWRSEIPEPLVFGAPSVGPDGTIYFGASLCDCSSADSGFVYAFNPDGSMKWRFKTENMNLSTGAVAQDGTYFYGSQDENLYAISNDGTLKWKRRFTNRSFVSEFSRPGIATAGEVIVAVDTGVVALDIETGVINWVYPANATGGFSISFDKDGSIYTGTMNRLLALNSKGLFKWEYPVKYGPGDVVIGALYFNLVQDSLLYALNNDGTLKWTFNVGSTRSTRPGIGPDGNIYTIDAGTPTLAKVSSEGTLVWRIELESLPGIHPNASIDIGNSVPLIDKENNIYINMSRTSGNNLFSINQEGEANWGVVVADGTLYSKPVFASDGTVYYAARGSLIAVR